MKRNIANRSLLHTQHHVPKIPGYDSKEPIFCPLPDPQDEIDQLIQRYNNLHHQLKQVRRQLQDHGVNPNRIIV